MVSLLRSTGMAVLVAFFLIGSMESLSVDARSHHLARREADAEGKTRDAEDDYQAFGDEGYEGDDFLGDGDGDNDDEEPYDDEDDDDTDLKEEETSPSIIISKPTNFTLPEGATVWLPCVTNNPEAVIIWKKKDQPLFQSIMKITQDPRIVRFANDTISISNLNSEDFGVYTCTMIGKNGSPTVLTHHVSKSEAPQVVRMLPEDRARLVPEGKPLKIECRVSGNPPPTITWSRKGQRLTPEEVEMGNQHIFIKSVRRQDSGMYQCLAFNGIGRPAHGAVDIKVLFSPEVHVRKSVVNTDEGYEAQMLCTIKSEPRATVVWERDGEVLKDSHHHHIVLDKNGDHSTLRILKVTPNDFGRYECKATNEYGHGEGHVSLVRHPGRALWLPGSQEEDSAPLLQWAVDSVQPITDVELRYYKVDEAKPERIASEEDWIIVKPDITQPRGNIYTIKHALHGLRPGKYAARLRAKNTHGWSDLSDQHTFDGDYETNEVLNERLEEGPASESVRSSAINNKQSSITIATTLLLSMVAYKLVSNM